MRALATSGPGRIALAAAPAAARVDLVIAGARGQVGSALCRQLDARRSALRDDAGIDLRVRAAFDRHGLAQADTRDGVGAATAWRPRVGGDLDALLAAAAHPGARATLFVDCTASDQVADAYAALLSAGIGVVAANKRANARSQATWRELQACARGTGAPYRYETTVGAAIPVLGPLRDLRQRGERVLALEGLLSGSLAHVLSRVHEGLAFSAAVDEARTLGYTEPDPLEDLCARDLVRKVLVLARECGFDLEPRDVRVDPLVDEALATTQGLAAALHAQDAPWRGRIDAARASGERWVMLAQVDADGARIGPRRVPSTSPFAALPAGQNLLRVRTHLQDVAPLVLGGPGAGPDVTAAGVLSDIVSAAREAARRGA